MAYDREAAARRIAEQEVAHRLLVQSIDYDQLLDEDGYPTEYALDLVEKWHWIDVKGWFTLIHQLWYLKSWGWQEGNEPHDWMEDKTVYRYNISTAGWSGNEAVIDAMQKNGMLWNVTWVQSRRGGHFIFEDSDLS